MENVEDEDVSDDDVVFFFVNKVPRRYCRKRKQTYLTYGVGKDAAALQKKKNRTGKTVFEAESRFHPLWRS